MDEPTAALTSDESARLLEIVRGLRDAPARRSCTSRTSCREVLSIADTVTVLRDGRLIHTKPAASETPATVVTAMLGRPMEMTFPDKVYPPADAQTVLSVRGLTRLPAFEDISFEVRAGEIVGLAGLIGSGRTEVARAIFGADRFDSGEVAPRRAGAQDPFATGSDSRRDRDAPRVAQGPGPAHAQPDHPERQPRPPRRGLARAVSSCRARSGAAWRS